MKILFKDALYLKSINECRAFCHKINHNELDRKQTNIRYKNRFHEILTDKQYISKRWHKYFNKFFNEIDGDDAYVIFEFSSKVEFGDQLLRNL